MNTSKHIKEKVLYILSKKVRNANCTLIFSILAWPITLSHRIKGD